MSNDKTCLNCQKNISPRNFYVSYNPMHKDKKIPYCKKCIRELSLNKNGTVNMEKFQSVLRQIDRPFLYDMFDVSVKSDSDTIGTYFKNIAMKQYRNWCWNDSLFDSPQNEECKDVSNNENDESKEIKNIRISKKQRDLFHDKYGYGFTDEEYLNFERKYKRISVGYKEKTALHTERLITYIIHKVKEEMATAKGDVSEAEKWAKLAQKDAQDAKLNISQLSKSDITGGIDLIPQLVEAIETRNSLIPIMPKLKEQPYDDADLIIWAIINKLRMVEDKPTVEYRDIWEFYDGMVREYYSQKGMTDSEIENEIKKRETPFRDLSKVYVEPLYEEDGDFMDNGDDIDDIL